MHLGAWGGNVSERSLTLQEGPVDTREQILDAATRVIRSRGLAGVTTREIAHEASCAEGTLYRHFDDKSELVLAVMRERFPVFIDVLIELPARAGTATVRRNLEEIASAAVVFFGEVVPIVASLFAEPKLLRSQREMMRAHDIGPQRALASISAYLREEQRLGRVARGVDPLAAATTLLGPCFQYVFLRHFLWEEVLPIPPERFVKEVVKNLLHGIAPAKGGKP
jgi:AcrR family transcriptional regulator